MARFIGAYLHNEDSGVNHRRSVKESDKNVNYAHLRSHYAHASRALSTNETKNMHEERGNNVKTIGRSPRLGSLERVDQCVTA